VGPEIPPQHPDIHEEKRSSSFTFRKTVSESALRRHPHRKTKDVVR
jgi:hypothetical protein